MKRNITTGLLILCLWANAAPRKINLQHALDLKMVKALAKSLGIYQGFCIQMELKNLSGDSLIILVEAGRRLNSVNDKEQDILITQHQLIVLKKMESRSFAVKGYCCQATNHAPSKNAVYDLNKMADKELVALATYLDQNPTEEHLEQAAIWAISDKRSLSTVASANDTTMSGVQLMVASIKGETIPWFALITKTHVFQSGAMQTFPVRLRGKMDYDTDKKCYATLHIIDENGTEVGEIVQQWIYPGAGQTYPLNIPVKGLAKGKYTIELNSPEKTLAKKEFEI